MREKEYGIWQTPQLVAAWPRWSSGSPAACTRRAWRAASTWWWWAPTGPRLYATMLAAQSLGAIPVPLYQDAVAAEFVFPINNAEVRFALRRGPGAGRQAAGDARRSARSCRRIYYDDPRGLRNYDEPGLASLDSLIAPGAAFAQGNAGFFAAEVAKAQPDDVAAMFFTSGTTGNRQGRGAHPPHAAGPRACRRASSTSSPTPRKCWPTCRRPGSARTSSATRSGWPAATW